MTILRAVFLNSNVDYRLCPPPARPEYAFIGRSNVGKSSLINRLTQQLDLAKTSQTPGKTQLINHFLIDDAWYLVDLPGYGWAKVGRADRSAWDTMIRQYLTRRPNLVCVFVLLDSRLEPQKVDLEFMQWLNQHEVPFAMVFTKTDKQSKTRTEANLAHYRAMMLEQWEELPPNFATSAVSGQGREEVLGYIEKLNHQSAAAFPEKGKKRSFGDFS